MLIFHKGHTDTIQVYAVTVMTHVKALQAGHSSQGTSEPITPASALLSGADGCANFAGDVDIGVASPTVLAGDVAVGVSSPAVAGAASPGRPCW